MGAQQDKQVQDAQNFSDYYLTETTNSQREMQYIDKLAAKLNQSPDEIQLIQAFLEQRGYKFSNRLLGKGGTSVVLRAENITNQKIALKILKCTSKEDYLGNLQEYRLMKQHNSEHVIKVHELLEYRSNNKLIQFLAMERCLCKQFSLLSQILSDEEEEKSQMTAGKKMNLNQIYEICIQLTKGLKDLHAQNVLHLDIKPGNIVLGFDNKWKFIDLGLSKLLPQNQSYTDDIQGLTKYYSSPEQYQLFYNMAQNKISRASDIYSLGMVFLELTGVRLKDDAKIEETKLKRTSFEQFFNPNYENLNKLISRMLSYNSDHRCNLSQVNEGTTTCGSSSPINNSQQYQIINVPMLKNIQRSRSNIKSDNILELGRTQKQKSMNDLTSNENQSSLSPKKHQYPYKLEQISQVQQIRNMLSKKLSLVEFTPKSSKNQIQDVSPMKARSKIILPSISKVPSPSKRSSPTNTVTRNFYLQKF